MWKLKLLIVFLLVGFKATSQNVIHKDSVVVLTEKQARAVATDLVRYDALKQVTKLQEERIGTFQAKEKLFGEQIEIKDLIITKQTSIIDKQNKILNAPEKIKLHSYLGIQTKEATLEEPTLRGDIFLEYKKIRAGAIYTIQQNNPSNWGILFQYRIF